MTVDAMVGILVTLLVFLSFGLLCLLWPEKIQSFAISHRYDSPYLDFMRSNSYIRMLRIIGFINTAIALFVIYAAFIQ